MAQLQGMDRAVGSGDGTSTAEVHHTNHAFPISVAAGAQKRSLRVGEDSIDGSALESVQPKTNCYVLWSLCHKHI